MQCLSKPGTGFPKAGPFMACVTVAAMAVSLSPGRAAAQETEAGSSMAGYGAFLDKYVVETAPGVTAVRYAAVSEADHQALQAFIDAQAAAGPGAGRDAAFAYWVNLYNAVTLDVVLDHYPVRSIRDIRFGLGIRPGPWREDLVTVDGEAMSLDDIEHGTLREQWDDPRVHFAVNCAAIGCPALQPVPFSADELDAQLDGAARSFINTERAVRLDDGALTLSSIFKWYGDDFGSTDAEIIAYVRGHADDDLAARLENVSAIDGYAYDWSLNEVRQDRQ